MAVSTPTTGPAWLRRYVAALIKRPWGHAARRSPFLRKYLDRHGYITPHFTWTSYACQDGTPVPPALRPNAIRLHWKLEELRHALGDIPMTVDGPYRTRQHNIDVGGASDSRHVHADAADFFAAQVDAWVHHGRYTRRGAQSREDVLRIAGRIFNDGGLGNENSGTLHVDARGTKARFITWTPAR